MSVLYPFVTKRRAIEVRSLLPNSDLKCSKAQSLGFAEQIDRNRARPDSALVFAWVSFWPADFCPNLSARRDAAACKSVNRTLVLPSPRIAIGTPAACS